jgi:hypothetical protein
VATLASVRMETYVGVGAGVDINIVVTLDVSRVGIGISTLCTFSIIVLSMINISEDPAVMDVDPESPIWS